MQLVDKPWNPNAKSCNLSKTCQAERKRKQEEEEEICSRYPGWWFHTSHILKITWIVRYITCVYTLLNVGDEIGDQLEAPTSSRSRDVQAFP